MSTATVAGDQRRRIKAIEDALGADARALLEHRCQGIPRETPAPARARLRGPRARRPPTARCPCCAASSSSSTTGAWPAPATSRSCPWTRASSTPAGASFAKNPAYFDPENIVKLAIEGGCNAVASTLGVLGAVARRYAHRIPFIVKINHNEFLTYPNKFDQILFAPREAGGGHGRGGGGRDHLLRLRRSRRRQIQEVGEAFQHAHEMGMATVLWCYLRNPAFKTKEKDYHVSADLTGQANHLGVTLRGRHHQAEAAGEQRRLQRAQQQGEPVRQDRQARLHRAHHATTRSTCTRYQVANCYMGRAGLINSGGASGRERLRGGGAHRGHQQARGRHGPHLRAQGLPAPDGRGRASS